MGPLRGLFPRPRTVSLGGVPYRVGELTFDDIADLEAMHDDRAGDPLEGLRPRLPTLRGPERREAILAAYDAITGGYQWSGPGTGAGGLLDLFAVALRRHQPGMTPDDAAAVAMATTQDEYGALIRALYAVTGMQEIHALLGMEESAGGEPITMTQAIVETATQFGYTPRQMGAMTPTQMRILRSGGRPPEWGVALASAGDIDATRERQRRALEGD